MKLMWGPLRLLRSKIPYWWLIRKWEAVIEVAKVLTVYFSEKKKFGRTRLPNLGLTSSAIPHSWLSFPPLTGDHWQPFGVSLVVALLLLLVLLLFLLKLLLLELQLLHIDNPLVSGAQKDSHCQTIGISPQLQICTAQPLNWTAEFWTSISRTDWSQMFARASHCRALNGCSAGRDKHR